jgi:hypothetical protein
MDYITLYRPGTEIIWVLQHNGNNFMPGYQQGDHGSGIGGFDLVDPVDSVFAFDYNSTGRQDYLVLYPLGTGVLWTLQNSSDTFTPVYGPNDLGDGIGGYDLRSPSDLGYAFDYRQNKKPDHIVLYRPGAWIVYIVEKS